MNNLPKIILLIIFSVFSFSCVYSQDLSYLEGMPSKENAQQVIDSKITDADLVTRNARKVAAFNLLGAVINIMARDRTMTQEEHNLQYEYRSAESDLKGQFTRSLTTREQKTSFQNACTKYENSLMDDFVFDSLVSTSAKQKIKAKIDSIPDGPTPPAKNDNSTAETLLFLFSGLSLIGAFWLKHTLNKYEFNNRTTGGVVLFKDYSASMWHNAKKVFANLLYGLGIILLVIGSIVHFGT